MIFIKFILVASSIYFWALMIGAAPVLSAEGMDSEEAQIATLKAKGYFRDVTCKEFANFILNKNDLPGLGVSKVTDRSLGRFNLDRGGENLSPPQFTDGRNGLQFERNKPRKTDANLKISANRITGKKLWEIVLKREWSSSGSKHQVASRYVFAYATAPHSEQDCKLLLLEYTALKDKHGPPPSILDGHACLKLTRTKDLPSSGAHEDFDEASSFLKSDCVQGSPFFLDLKGAI